MAGNGTTIDSIVPAAGGVTVPHDGVKIVTPFGPGGLLMPTSGRRWFEPCHVDSSANRWTTRLPAVPIPIDERPGLGALL